MIAPMAPMAPMMRLQGLQDAMRPMEIDIEKSQRAAEAAQVLAERQVQLATVRARLAETQARLAEPSWSESWGPSGGKGWLQGDAGSMLTLGGLRMSVVSPQLASYFGKGSEDGLLLLDVSDYWHPLQAGDVILSVNGKSVRDGDHASISLDSNDDNTFVVLRKGAHVTVHVKAH
jgi:S1-C subfamily serine protease